MADDGVLWRRAQAGDEVAFEMLFERHAAAIHGFCFRRSGDWSLAEELTSATFFEAWRRRGRIGLHTRQVKPWLYGVANNLTRNSTRARRRYASALARIPEERADPDFADDAAERLAAEGRVKDMLASLARLPRNDLETVVLVCWQGLSHAEAAFALGVPEATVRTRLFRARRRLAASAALIEAQERDFVKGEKR